ncbi:MAG: hypothetical protein IKM31_03570 [Oscillospiraceae bacterium]|nr:hypothetical protein [Oscillospiraceae bacterium]
MILSNWKLTVVPNKTVKQTGFDPRTVSELESCGHLTVPASVPGNFELDLFREGLIPDPYFGTDTLEMQKLENRHLWYHTVFDAPDGGDTLFFGGIDTFADVYLNGEKIGHTENMLIPHELPAKGLKETGNELIIHISPTAIMARETPGSAAGLPQPYTDDFFSVRKPGSMFGWDIMPRIVSGGLWKAVELRKKLPDRLEEVFLHTAKLEKNGSAKLECYVRFHADEDYLTGYRLVIEGRCGDSAFRREVHPFTVNVHSRITVADAKLWWPRNAGEQNLYDVSVRLYKDGVLCDEKKFRSGIRKAELCRTSCTDEAGNGEFVFKINGRKIFCLGTNWVPLDAFPSRHIDYLPRALGLLTDIGCNMVRCWGGNVYENDEFYDFCDEHGIMIWQDFSMACGFYPQDESFQKKLAAEAEAVVKRLRNHVSLTLWSGDNECDSGGLAERPEMDPNQNVLTRKVLPEVLHQHDFSRPYLPSSPYMDEEAFRTGGRPSEDHLWGPRDYFKGEFYKGSVCHFASETGYHGCPSPESLKKFIPAEHLWTEHRNMKPDGTPDDAWLVHAASMELDPTAPYAYRIKLMNDQVVTLFGSLPDDLNTYARMSQISQAEAKKYFIERFRLSKWRRTGILWWNLIDGWPQISDAVVDHYGVKKLAYHYIKRSQQPVCMMFDEPEDGLSGLYGVNDTMRDAKVDYTVTRLSDGETVLRGEAVIPADSSVRIGGLPVGEEKDCLLIEWSGDVTGSNHYFTNIIDISYEAYTDMLGRAGYLEFEGF